jgi:hypothetical protein
VIDDEDLGYLKGGDVLGWATGVPANSRQERLLESLGIEMWGWGDLLRSLEGRFGWNDRTGKGQEWLARHDDDWFRGFYALLAQATEKTKGAYLGVNPTGWIIVPTQDGRYLKGSETFFPPSTGCVDLEGIPSVKAEILDERDKERSVRARTYLTTIGVRDVGRREEVVSILNANYALGKSRTARRSTSTARPAPAACTSRHPT